MSDAPITRWLLGWSWRTFWRNLDRVSTTTAVATLVNHLLNGKPEIVFRGSMEPGTAIEIRALEPGEG